ncbi:hypothetical protein NHQ30_009278 [Ciborinia camelliae]|nr:hypothetical protein NHQ30_009278 [Ciborinia camelliae]
MADWGPGGHEPLRRRMFGCEFTYDNINLLQCKGYSFDALPNPEEFHEKYYDIDYWKAQLAFRGASSAGDNMVQLIERCIHAELPDRMHPRVAVMGIRLAREWVRLTWGEDEVEDEWGEDAWGEDEWDDDMFDEEMEDEEMEENEQDEEDDEYEDYDENYEDMEEDIDDDYDGNFEEIIDSGRSDGMHWNVVYRSYHL